MNHTPYEILEAPQAHWKYIEKTVVAHDDLVKALKDICACVKASGPHGTTMYFISDERMQQAQTALNKAGVKL